METRRFLLAVSLSLLVVFIYLRLFAPQPQTAPEQKQQQTEQTKIEKTESQSVKPTKAATKIRRSVQGRDIVIETDLINVVVNTAGGVIKSWELKKYREADKTEVGLTALYKKITGSAKREETQKKELGNVQLMSVNQEDNHKNIVFPLTIEPINPELSMLSQVEFSANRSEIRLGKDKPTEILILTYRGPRGLMIEKSLKFYSNEYRADIVITTKGLPDGYLLNLGTDFGFADKVSSDASGRVGLVAQINGKTNAEKIGSIEGEVKYSGFINWFGQEDKYFAAAVLSGEQGIVTSKRTPATADSGDLLSTVLTVKEKPEARTITLYAGPKSYTRLVAYGQGLEQMVDYGWFGILAKPMFWFMEQCYAVTRNYGIAIILLTILIRILLFYPSLKSALSMEEMKKIQPLVNELKEKYKKDPKRMSEETMKLYKEHKVNPLGGCLPMLLQFPFFIALYNVLSVSIELRQATFISFWIKDLSVHDPYYILPVLMGISMILMMKMTAATPDPQQAKIIMIMNIAFIFMFAWLPAGLLLYITLSNVLSIVQQLYVHRILSKRATAVT